jgi:hypothetical protein
MTLSPTARRVTLVLHLTVTGGWIGGAVAYLALGVAAGAADEPEAVRGMWAAMELTGWYALVPLAAASLVTGIALALGSRWGLFTHYWVVISLVLTSVATAVLVLHMPSVSDMVERLGTMSADEITRHGGDVLHPALGLVVLLVVQVLNVFKPAGMTSYGERRRRRAA